jgi:gamma-glutamyltranspeptidase/glutathione hydrolase
VNVVDFDMDVRAAVDAPRMHQQWLPDEIRLERSPLVLNAESRLKEMGHVIRHGQQGDAHTIVVDPKTGEYRGAADTRLRGGAAGY